MSYSNICIQYYKCPFKHWFAAPSKFWQLCFISLGSEYFFNFSLWCPSLSHVLLDVCCLTSKYFETLLKFFCYWFLVWFHCYPRAYFVWFLLFKLYDVCFMALNVVHLDVFYVSLRKCVSCCFVFWECLLNSGILKILFSSTVSLLGSWQLDLWIPERVVLKTPL